MTQQNFSAEGIGTGGDVSSNTVTGGGSVISTGTGGGGGAGTFCFTGDTLFKLFDGSSIIFERLFNERDWYIGDEAKSFNKDGREVKGLIVNVFESIAFEYAKVFFADGSVDKVKPNHRYFTPSGEYVEIGKLGGAEVLTEFNVPLKVINIAFIQVPEGIKMYNTTIKDHANYCANGKRVSNAKNPDILIS